MHWPGAHSSATHKSALRHERPVLVIALLALLTACEPSPPPAPDLALPPMPMFDTSGFDQAVATQLTDMQQRLANAPEDGHNNARFARMLHAYSLHAPAAVMYERCRLLRPNDLECPYLEALVRRQLGDTARATELLEALLARKPDFPRATAVLADNYRQQGDLERALPLFERAASTNASDLEAQYGLAMSLLDRGDLERAKGLLEALHQNGRHFGVVHAALATIARQQQRKDALVFHTAAATRFADEKIPFVDQVLWDIQKEQLGDQRLTREAQSLFQQGRLREAAARYVQALSANPNNAGSHTSLVGIYGQLGNLSGAQRHFEQARALQPGDVAPLVTLGTVMLKRAEFSQARDLFLEAVALQPEHAEARTLAAYCAELLGEPLDTDALRQALRDDPTQSLAQYLLGRQLTQRDGCAAALPYLRDSVRLESAQTPAFMAELVRCLAEQGDVEQARSALAQGFVLARHYRNAGAQRALEQVRDELKMSSAGSSGRP